MFSDIKYPSIPFKKVTTGITLIPSTSVEQVKLAVLGQLAFGAFTEDRQTVVNQQIFKDGKMESLTPKNHAKWR